MAASTLPTVARGDLYKQLEWVLLDGHSQLLDMLLARGDNPALIAQRCERLSALIRCASIPHSPQLAKLQEKVTLNDRFTKRQDEALTCYYQYVIYLVNVC